MTDSHRANPSRIALAHPWATVAVWCLVAIGGLIAFLLIIGRTYMAKKFTHELAISAIVVSYYWHFVDIVWVGLFATIYMIR